MVPWPAEELKLLHRASRDDWADAAFHARCGDDSPSTTNLFRVKRQGGDHSDIVIRGSSSVPWTGDGDFCPSPGAFLFMLESGSANGSTPFQPVKKWNIIDGRGFAVRRGQQNGPYFGGGPNFGITWANTSATLCIGVEK